MVGSDDFMGQADFDLTTCELHKPQEVTLHLGDADNEDLIRYTYAYIKKNLHKNCRRKNKKKKTLGYIITRLVLSPMTKEEYNEVCCFIYDLGFPTFTLGYSNKL